MEQNLYALILAGGSGTRLWPKSRKASPKHLLHLHGNLSMIGETVARINTLIPDDHIFIVTRQDQVADIVKDLPQIPKEHVIAEPAGKNTAWAMGLGTYYIAKENPNAVIVNLAADHVIANKDLFHQTVLAAKQAAEQGDYLITIGITPDFPHTGLGYIRIGEKKEEITGMPVYKVVSFVEKPDKPTAESFLATNEYFWNANLYTWSAASIKKALHDHAPHVAAGLEQIDAAIGTDQVQQVIEQVYAAAEDTQIDKGVSEKASNLLMIPGNFGWNDIGDWSVLYDIKEKDANGNVILGEGQVMTVNTKNSLFNTDKRLIAAIGIDDLVVIDTPNALLICKREASQDVKKIVEALKQAEQTEYL